MSADDVEAALRAELAAAKAENELLLQQITRLCLFIEQHSSCDPIAIMYARGDEFLKPSTHPAPQSAPAPSVRGWFYRKIAGDGGLSQPEPTSSPPRAVNGGTGFRAAPLSPQGLSDTPAEAHTADTSSFVSIDDAVGGAVLEWRGDPEAIETLDRRLTRSTAVASLIFDGVGFTRLPSSVGTWSHLATSLLSLSLNGNNLAELPVAFERLQRLRRLRLEGNLFRAMPPPVLQLTTLEELGIGCNQLTGVPDGIERLVRLEDLWLVSNEISYLPQVGRGRALSVRGRHACVGCGERAPC